MSPLHRTFYCTAVAGLLVLPFTTPASAQSKLEARYGITVAGISVGKGAWTIDIGTDQYSMSTTGSASGIASVMVSGEGTVTVRGAMKDGKPLPASFASSVVQDKEKTELKMTLDGGNVKDVTVAAAPPADDRIEITDAHKRGVIDPLSALLVPAAATGAAVSAEACAHTLPIFDGRRRFDLKLSFKRIDKVKADKGYAGPVAVCAVTLQPQAGYRKSSTLVKYLSDGREIEIWFAPVAGTKVLAPFRLSVANMLGNLVVQANQFEVLAQTAAK